MFKKGVIVFVLGLLLSVPVMAEDLHAALKIFKEKGMTVDFLGTAHGMDGWAVSNNEGRVQYAYSTPEGGLVMGFLYDDKGVMVTDKQIALYKARQEKGEQSLTREKRISAPVSSKVQKVSAGASPAEKGYAAVEKSYWFPIGRKGAPHIYVFINPKCITCLQYWKNTLEKQVANGTIQVRFVPYGKTKVNHDASAVLLSAEDPEQVWLSYANGNADALSTELANDEGYRKATENAELWTKHKLPLAPFTLYFSPVNGKIKAIVGKTENDLLMMSDFIPPYAHGDYVSPSDNYNYGHGVSK